MKHAKCIADAPRDRKMERSRTFSNWRRRVNKHTQCTIICVTSSFENSDTDSDWILQYCSFAAFFVGVLRFDLICILGQNRHVGRIRVFVGLGVVNLHKQSHIRRRFGVRIHGYRVDSYCSSQKQHSIWGPRTLNCDALGRAS